LARPERFELPTTRFEAEYSIQLSYGRVLPTETILRRPPQFWSLPSLSGAAATGSLRRRLTLMRSRGIRTMPSYYGSAALPTAPPELSLPTPGGRCTTVRYARSASGRSDFGAVFLGDESCDFNPRNPLDAIASESNLRDAGVAGSNPVTPTTESFVHSSSARFRWALSQP
jgi:hypothetical protein